MIKWWTIGSIVLVIALALLTGSKRMQMKTCYAQYQSTRSQTLRNKYVERGRGLMSTKLLPYILGNYRDERDIQFTIAMIAACRTADDNIILWDTVRNTPTGQQIRIVCMSQLLSRGFLEVWSEITEADIEMISSAMPVHVVYWKNLLLQYSGKPSKVLSKDTYPERHKFKALFRECIRKYKAEEEKRALQSM